MKKVIFILIVVLLFNNCMLFEEVDNAPSIDITIKSNEDVILDSSAQIKFKLWGIDHNWADVSATLLHTYIEEINDIPTTFSLVYDQEWSKNIEPNTGENSNFVYYITLTVDANGDGYMDNRDYIRDYDLSPFNSQSVMIDLSSEIYIKPKYTSSGSEF